MILPCLFKPAMKRDRTGAGHKQADCFLNDDCLEAEDQKSTHVALEGLVYQILLVTTEFAFSDAPGESRGHLDAGKN